MADSEQTTTTPEAMRGAVISMAVESWRFGRGFDRLLLKLDAAEQNRYKSQILFTGPTNENRQNCRARFRPKRRLIPSAMKAIRYR